MNFATIKSEGLLIPSDLLTEIYSGEAVGQKAKDLALDKNIRITDEIAACWADSKAFWEAFKHSLRKVPKAQTGATQTREQWILPLLRTLGFEGITFSKSAAQVGGRTYFISHRFGEGDDGMPIHIEGANVDLDRRSAAGCPRLSPHALVQEYLNRTEHLWGIATNGKKFRILRDSERLIRPTYLEFDLEQMMNGEHFSEFQLFYRLVHRTRWPQKKESAHECLLEQYYQQGIEAGGRVRERLRDGVEEALKIFGNGFLNHPDNEDLKNKIQSGEISTQDYYRRLLLLIYRFLFLMVSEERNLVGPVPQNDHFRFIYDHYYSISRLRQKVEKPVNVENRHWDLWESVKQTFRLYGDKNIGQKLGVSPLGGHLFGENALSYFEDAFLYNKDFLHGFAHLSISKAEKVTIRINYGHLDVEELGSVYESLLEYHPVLRRENGSIKFEFTYGTERKSTGSYYTRSELVNELIKSALVPVMEDRLNKEKTKDEKEKALLSLKVCDPACGSGHFLLATARRIGKELAKIRTGEEQPTPPQFRSAVRDVIRQCIYGVDLNPLAVDLCKVALWIEGHNRNLPLTFLDHRIKCGNSLIGLDKMERSLNGIPDDAFKPVTGDNKEVAKKTKALNRNQRQEWNKKQLSLDFNLDKKIQDDLDQFSRWNMKISETSDVAIEDYKKKSNFYENIKAGGRWWNDWTAANIWTSAFFYPLTDENDPAIPTHDKLMEFLRNPNAAHGQLVGEANALALKQRFFHWPLEFPEVFKDGGFDVTLGNPPWERIKLQEQEFFLIHEKKIAEAPNKAARTKLIKQLPETNPNLAKKFAWAKHNAESTSQFVRTNGRFSLTGVGDVNTYALFAELSYNLINPNGRVGIIVPTGIATDDTYKQFFGYLNHERHLLSLFDFENREKLFPAVDSRYKFCLLTISRKSVENNYFAFFLTRTEHLDEEIRHFSLSREEIELINPNTKTLPIFRTKYDSELQKNIIQNIPILLDETTKQKYWDIRFITLFHMANDSHLFFKDSNKDRLPLYEAKMIWQYNHRFGTYDGVNSRSSTHLPTPSLEQLCNPNFTILPWYWVSRNEVEKRLGNWRRKWLLGFRDITNATNERTAIFSILPRAGVGHKTPLVIFNEIDDIKSILYFIGNVNSLVFDYCARQKIGGTHFGYYIFKQLPILPLHFYSSMYKEFIPHKILELIYTAWDLKPFAEDMGYDNAPFEWDDTRREIIKAELDAHYAKLYGFSRDELRYILDPQDVYGPDFPGETFRVLKKKEIKRYGEYRTRRLVLEAWDRLFGSD